MGPRQGHDLDSVFDKFESSQGTLDHAWAGASLWHQGLIQTLNANIASLKSKQSHEAIDANVTTCSPEKSDMAAVCHMDTSISLYEKTATIVSPQPPTIPPSRKLHRRRQAVLTSRTLD